MTTPSFDEKAREIIRWWTADKSLCQRDLIPKIAEALAAAHAQGVADVMSRVPDTGAIEEAALVYFQKYMDDDIQSAYERGARWCAAKITEK